MRQELPNCVLVASSGEFLTRRLKLGPSPLLAFLIMVAAAGPTAVAEVQLPRSISSDTTWTAADSPYWSYTDVTIEEGVILTIEPGVVVKLHKAGSLYVNGGLAAQGAEGAQIIFTSIKDDTDGHDTNGDGADSVPAKRDWGGILFSDTCADSVLSHVVIRYGGGEYSFPSYPSVPAIRVRSSNILIASCIVTENFSHGIQVTGASRTMEILNCIVDRNRGSGIYLDNASPTIVGNIITENGGSPARPGVFLRRSSNPDIRDNRIADNAHWAIIADASSSGAYIHNNELAGPRAGIFVLGGGLVADTTWASDSVYVVDFYRDQYTKHLTITEGATLIIEPGVVAKFEKYARLLVEGDLIAQGTPEEQIVFTSLQDDSHGGDTNGDGDATSPAKNDWGNLSFTGVCAGSVLKQAVVRYAGWTYIAPHWRSLSAIQLGPSCGIEIGNCTISDSGHGGIYVGGCNPTIVDNVISNNGDDGIYLHNAYGEITRNTVTGNEVGVYDRGGMQGAMYLNNFIVNFRTF